MNTAFWPIFRAKVKMNRRVGLVKIAKTKIEYWISLAPRCWLIFSEICSKLIGKPYCLVSIVLCRGPDFKKKQKKNRR